MSGVYDQSTHVLLHHRSQSLGLTHMDGLVQILPKILRAGGGVLSSVRSANPTHRTHLKSAAVAKKTQHTWRMKCVLMFAASQILPLAAAAGSGGTAPAPNQCASADFTIVRERDLVFDMAADLGGDGSDSGSGDSTPRGADASSGSDHSAALGSNAGPVLVERTSGWPVEVASFDTTVVNSLLVERASGKPVQTAPALDTSEVPDGIGGLLEKPLESIRQIKTLIILHGGRQDSSESYDISSVRQTVGDGMERVISLGTCCGEILLVRSLQGSQALRIIDPDEMSNIRRLTREMQPQDGGLQLGGTVKQATRTAMLVFPDEYHHVPESYRAEDHVLMQRLQNCTWDPHWCSQFAMHIACHNHH